MHSFKPCSPVIRHSALLVLVAGCLSLVSAEFNRTPLLIDAPTADAQRYGSLLLSASGSQGLTRDTSIPGGERNLNFSLSPVRRLTLAATAYTRRDYVLGASYQLLDGGKRRASLAVGVHDMGLSSHISPIGRDDNVWPDEKYDFRPYENFSGFVVISVPVGSLLRLDAGLGRGRYVGYGDRSKYLNTDILFGGHHQWAVGLFGGAELKLLDMPTAQLPWRASLALEEDGRDVNAGVKANIGPVEADVALSKLEGVLSKEQFERVSVAVSYEARNIIGRRVGHQPLAASHQSPVFGSLAGSVDDSKTGKPVPAQLIVLANDSGKVAQAKTTQADETGAFRFAELKPGAYTISVECPGYLRRSADYVVTRGAETRFDIQLDPEDLTAQPPDSGYLPLSSDRQSTSDNLAALGSAQSLALKPVYFQLDQSVLTGQARQILKEDAQVLKANPDARIVILGRACEIGSDEYNLKLGDRRARAACDFLLQAGIAPARLDCRSLGKTQPVPGAALWTCRRCDFELEPSREAR
jgi:peptidoglycan-associated lipoprotein